MVLAVPSIAIMNPSGEQTQFLSSIAQTMQNLP